MTVFRMTMKEGNDTRSCEEAGGKTWIEILDYALTLSEEARNIS